MKCETCIWWRAEPKEIIDTYNSTFGGDWSGMGVCHLNPKTVQSFADNFCSKHTPVDTRYE